jgi:hypothetical protein
MSLARIPLLALLSLAAACQSSQPPPTRLSNKIFEDVITPRGATYIDTADRSFSYEQPTFRCGRFAFDWQGPEADAVRFYKERMTAPPYSWSFTGEDGADSGSTRLHFVKGDDRCTVDVDRIPKPGIEKKNNLSIVIRVNCRK